MWLTGPAAPRHVGSSQTRARTRVPRISRQILNHCATREALFSFLNSLFVLLVFKIFLSYFFIFFLCVCVCVCVCVVLLLLLFVCYCFCYLSWLLFVFFSFFSFLVFLLSLATWCSLWALDSPARGWVWATGAGGPSPGCWTAREFPGSGNINQYAYSRR